MAAGGNRRAGIIYLKIDGALQEAKGSFSYNLGRPKRDAIVGADGIHGYKETPQIPFIEGAITDSSQINLEKLVTLDEVTVHLELNNGKTVVLSNAWYASEGTPTTEEAEIPVRFESRQPGQEV